MDMRRLVGRNLRRHRLDKGLTQEQLAERSGYSQQQISNVERGIENPTVVTLYWLAHALEIEPHLFMMPDPEAAGEKPAPHPKRPAPRGPRRP